MMESIIVIMIVAVAALFVGRSLYRTVTGKSSACSCSTGCPFADGCEGIPPFPSIREQTAIPEGPPCMCGTKTGSIHAGEV
jgi:hypothetical protein